ncbi:putative oxidoreductase,short chain dehydrogenase [Myriangium duriaei CBS 260.36]|uniref:Oxidoreductase,short chain dehydrogenase n=1 Tax=Myriangium duriaei CBS 260.36 TaxID=1168546 RepID=A0A9P4MK91_9PEZI|nr:putative oxidoreductase,short chain dehydrogenase [Myriangium duriaei CBS 260.36]
MKVWFITGCSSGLGECLARAALQRGDKVIATAQRTNRLQSLAAAGATTMELDLNFDAEQMKRVATEAWDLHGGVDILINNAGIAQVGAVEEISKDEWQRIFRVNVFGPVDLANAFVPHMRKRKSGVIANISSLSAWQVEAGAAPYQASKAALSSICLAMAAELKPFGIDVCCIEPGYFRTKLLDNICLPSSKLAVYNGSAVRELESGIDSINGKQPGNPEKGAKVIVDVVTKATGRDVPNRLLLGPDAVQDVRDFLDQTKTDIAGWENLTTKTDFTHSD